MNGKTGLPQNLGQRCPDSTIIFDHDRNAALPQNSPYVMKPLAQV